MLYPVFVLLFGVCGNECIKLFCGETENIFDGVEKTPVVGDVVARRFFFRCGVKVAAEVFAVSGKGLAGNVPAHFFVPVGEVLIGVADPEPGVFCGCGLGGGYGCRIRVWYLLFRCLRQDASCGRKDEEGGEENEGQQGFHAGCLLNDGEFVAGVYNECGQSIVDLRKVC